MQFAVKIISGRRSNPCLGIWEMLPDISSERGSAFLRRVLTHHAKDVPLLGYRAFPGWTYARRNFPVFKKYRGNDEEVVAEIYYSDIVSGAFDY